MKKKKQLIILSLTTLLVSLTALWRATGLKWIVWAMVVVTAMEVWVYTKK